jgi:hypothetical protein
MDGPALTPGALSTVGLPLDEWDETHGLNEENAENGAVFFMDPVSTLPRKSQIDGFAHRTTEAVRTD